MHPLCDKMHKFPLLGWAISTVPNELFFSNPFDHRMVPSDSIFIEIGFWTLYRTIALRFIRSILKRCTVRFKYRSDSARFSSPIRLSLCYASLGSNRRATGYFTAAQPSQSRLPEFLCNGKRLPPTRWGVWSYSGKREVQD